MKFIVKLPKRPGEVEGVQKEVREGPGGPPRRVSSALSASQHAISQGAARASREVVASSQMMRAADKAVHMNMQGGW